jgi:hypothetical protein
MTREELSNAISDAELRNPRLRVKRERAVAKGLEHRFGKEVCELEEKWNQFADGEGFILAVYAEGKEKVVDVLQVNEALITKTGKLKLAVSAPKLRKDRIIGRYLEWDRTFQLPIESLLYHEALNDGWYDHDAIDFEKANQVYGRLVKKGKGIAKRY